MRVRRSYSKSRGPKNNIWTALVLSEVAIATSVVESTIVTPGDWSGQVGTGFEKATLLRTRGWLSASLNQVSTIHASLFMMIYVTDAGDATHSPSLAASYATEDVLWSAGYIWGPGNASALERTPTMYFSVDIKSMRKFDSAKQLRLSLVSTASAGLEVSGVLRGLMRKS